MRHRRSFIAFTAIVMCGCASVPDLIPTGFVEPPKNDLSTLIIFRISAMPTKLYARMMVDGELKALLPDGCVTWIQVPAGEHKVAASFPAISGTSSAEVSHSFLPGETYFLEYAGGAPNSGVPVVGERGILVGAMGASGSFWNKLYVLPSASRASSIRRLPYVAARVQ